MFKDTVTFSKFRLKLKNFLELVQNKDDAIQIVHKANPIRVIITQEYFLDLRQKVEMYEIELGLKTPEISTKKFSKEEHLKRLKDRRIKMDQEEQKYEKQSSN